MAKLILLALFSLTASAHAADNREPAGVQRLALDIVYVETVAEVEALHLKLLGPLTQGDLQGFAAAGTRPDGTPTCLIVALRPGKNWANDRTTVLGHELRHCLGEKH